MQLVNPTLVIALACRQRVDFRRDAHYSGDVAGLGLRAGHTSETCGDKERSTHLLRRAFQPALAELHPGGVHHCDCGAVHDALRADVHVGAGRHLPVLAHAEGVHALPVVGLGVVGDDHAVGHDHSRCAPVGGEEAEGVSGVHHEGLLVGHLREVSHHQAVLRPVLEDGSVASVGYQLVRVLGHARVEVVLYHGHNGRRLTAPCRVLVYRTGQNLV